LFYQKAFEQFSISEMLAVGLSETEIIEFKNAFVIEQTHVNTLVTVLQSLNVEPLAQPEFFFSFSSPVDFVKQLAVQETYCPFKIDTNVYSLATEAYLGAAPFVTSSEILGAAASIMAIEARQSSFTNSVLGINAFSSAFETSLSIEQVVSLVAPSIVSIPPGTILEALGFDVESFAVAPIEVTAFVQVEISSTFLFSYAGGAPIVPPEGVSKLFCAYSVGLNTFFTEFTPGTGCEVSPQIISGSVVNVQITVAESTSIGDLLTAPQFITCV
jgi:Ferritin-like domain